MYNAMWQNMQETVLDGADALHGELIERDSDGDIVRDAFAVGGIRPTQIQVPVATYGPQNEPNPANLPGPLILLGNLFCFSSGTQHEDDFEAEAAGEAAPPRDAGTRSARGVQALGIPVHSMRVRARLPSAVYNASPLGSWEQEGAPGR